MPYYSFEVKSQNYYIMYFHLINRPVLGHNVEFSHAVGLPIWKPKE